jgi:hypothetical protein
MSDDMTRGEELKAAFEAGRAAFAADLREQGKVVVDRKVIESALSCAKNASWWCLPAQLQAALDAADSDV